MISPSSHRIDEHSLSVMITRKHKLTVHCIFRIPIKYRDIRTCNDRKSDTISRKSGDSMNMRDENEPRVKYFDKLKLEYA